ncbi:diguanylate cyclase domain-containing protein [Shewanella maritima]|uniref:sensor domain-containing diguanylate cyclase n=1 Tax=Shewanella maritima TaxID=2520507 RepID=UPI003736C805
MTLSFRHLLFLMMLLISLIPITTISIWSANSALENEHRMVHDKHLLLAKNLTRALNRYAVDALAIFTAATNIESQQVMNEQMAQLLASIDVESIAKYSDNGELIHVSFGGEYSVPHSLINSQMPFELSLLNEARFTPVHKTGLERPTVYMIRQDGQGYIWLATMQTTYIEHLQSAVEFGEKGHAAIVDSQGNVLAHPNKQWQQQAKNISKISIVQQMMSGESGVSEFYSPAVKADMIAGFDVVPATGWGVMIPQPIQELESSAFNVIKVTLLVGFLSLLVCCIVSWWITRLITRPIDVLTDKTRHLITEQQMPLVTPHKFHTIEFAKLFDSFRQMALDIRAGREELEARVADRTADLAQAQAKAVHLANHDAVTGLANRMSIRRQIDQQLAKQHPFCLLFIDLDGFKAVNDKYGHAIGDSLLVAVAKRLNRHLFIDDVLARYGGDEFLVLMPGTANISDAQQAAEKLLSILEQPFEMDGYIVIIGACIGITVSHTEIKSSDELIHHADQAMYQAKHNGKNQVYVALQEEQWSI